MPISGAEKTRRYREKLKQNPEKLEIQRKKNLERIKSKKKRITELTPEEAEIRRENWRNYKKTSRLKKLKKKIILADSQNGNALSNDDYVCMHSATSASTTSSMDNTHNSNNSKVVKRLRKKCRLLSDKCRRVTEYNEIIQMKKETNRKKFYRMKRQMQKQIDDFKVKIMKMRARQELLESTITRTYKNCKKNNEKKILKKMVTYSENKRLATAMLGLKGKAREKVKKNLRRPEIAEISKFYVRDDISRNTAGKKETRTRGKEKVQIRYLLDSLVNTFKKYRREGGKYGFTTFYRHKPFYVLSPGLSSRSTCLCIKHSNFCFLHTAMVKQGLVTGSTREIVAQVSCNTSNYDCMWNKCRQCKNKNVVYETINDEKFDSQVQWLQWERQDHIYQKNDGQTTQDIHTKKTAKVTKTGTLNDLKKQYEHDLILFKKHHFNMVHQQAQFQKAVNELKQNEVLIVCDFSENYAAKLATEIQSMHYGASNRQISLHTGMVFWKDRSQSFCTLSDNTSHQPAAIWAHLAPIIDMIRQETPETTIIHFYSDGPSSQYRQKKNFYLLAYFTNKYGFKYTTWSFYESGHGKNVADGIGGSVKRTLDRKVCHGNDVASAKDAHDLLKHCLRITKVFLIDSCEIDKISNTLPNKLPVLKGTMQLHQVITSHDGNPFNIGYRDISCFCGDLKGQCDCFSPQSHSVTMPVMNRTEEESNIITHSTTDTSGLTQPSLFESIAEDITSVDTVCEPPLPSDLVDICLKPLTDSASEAIDVGDISVFPLGEENESLLWSNSYHVENQTVPIHVDEIEKDKSPPVIIPNKNKKTVDVTVPLKKIHPPKKTGRSVPAALVDKRENNKSPPAITLKRNIKTPAVTILKKLPPPKKTGRSVPAAPVDKRENNKSPPAITLKRNIKTPAVTILKKLPQPKKDSRRIPAAPLEELNRSSRYVDENKIHSIQTEEIEKNKSPQVILPRKRNTRTIQNITFIECNKCLTSILGQKGKCMVCKKWYCSECFDGHFGIDYICDSCLEG